MVNEPTNPLAERLRAMWCDASWMDSGAFVKKWSAQEAAPPQPTREQIENLYINGEHYADGWNDALEAVLKLYASPSEPQQKEVE